MLVRTADWCYRQRRLVVVLWIAALAAAFALASSFGVESTGVVYDGPDLSVAS